MLDLKLLQSTSREVEKGSARPGDYMLGGQITDNLVVVPRGFEKSPDSLPTDPEVNMTCWLPDDQRAAVLRLRGTAWTTVGHKIFEMARLFGWGNFKVKLSAKRLKSALGHSWLVPEATRV